ncbi:MAG: nucleotidyltransferase family protein [Cyanobacteria bacterium J06554_11]
MMLSTAYFPLTQVQKWLLQATLMKRDDAVKAWQQWRDHVDIETLDPDSHHVLSALYPALARYQVADPHIGRLKGVYRRTWYGNQLLLKRWNVTFEMLAKAGIETVLLGEMALLAACYQDFGARTFTQLDLLMSPSATQHALEILAQIGWHRLGYKPDFAKRLYHPITLKGPNGFLLRLYNHLFWAEPQDHTDQQLWDKATFTTINSRSVRVLSPVDQLLMMSLKINQGPLIASPGGVETQRQHFYYLADATFIVGAITTETEWVRLLAQAQRYEIILPLRYLLAELQAQFEIDIPDWVLPGLRKMAISYHELLTYRLLSDDRLLRLKAQLVKLRHQWRQLTRSSVP